MGCPLCGLTVTKDREADHARYVHPTPAPCACGCGERVSSVAGRRERRFSPGHYEVNALAKRQALRALRGLKLALEMGAA